ncbi:EAL domain-containing protein [Sphingomonas sp. RB56-2]|uniref:EAL domain-containing protein n=1 Tax=Sphingomonas brevis TaxID=2908206 RepID=A0ABT0S6T0_9SPHN|nr:EAL domain-containing protein [Sphingomonas brevis]MCL6740108.1 EAL domain-containing protein [Sphingomonas brevis]
MRPGASSAQDDSRPQSSRAEGLIQEFENSEKGWFWETGRDGTLSYISDNVARALGREPEDLLNRPFSDLTFSETADGAGTSERTLGFYLSSHVAFQDLIVRAKTKNEIWWSISGRPVHDEAGRFFGFRGYASDLTKMRQSEVELDRLARQDSLTGLANREALRRALDDALVGAVRRKHRCSVFLLDLDRFKAVNDTLGHPAGDTLLRLVALRLTDEVGKAGQVGRLGGDEFQVVLPAMSSNDELSKVAQGIIDSLSRPYTINGTLVSIGASVGIVTSDYDDRTSDDLMRDADLALYAAKAAGKGCFRFFAPEMHEAARERQLMESDLRVALEKGQLRVVYQPQVDASSEEVTGFEALIRWDHPEHGPVSPAVFIPLAEEIRLIDEIGEWVLRTACAEAANWPPHISVAVNLSPIQFKSPALTSTVRMVLGDTGLPAKRLELEITEGVFLSNDDHVHDMIRALKDIGIKLALDDFGTGYSSLSYLQRVPFDKIKIDRSFVNGASDPESRNAALIRAMVGLASDLKMRTIAEGVETPEELQLVRDLGCPLVQGYIFGKPMPAEEALELAKKGAATLPAQLPPREPRIRIIRATLLHHLGQVKGARLRNISSGGALVECREEMTVGAEIQLDFAAGGLIDAEIRWVKGTQFGVQFREKFDLRLLQPAKPAPTGSTVMKPDYLTSGDASETG